MLDYILNIDIPVGFLFLLPIICVIGGVVVIARKHSQNPDLRSQTTTDWDVFNSPGPSENPFDLGLDRQLDLAGVIEKSAADEMADNDYYDSISKPKTHSSSSEF